MRVRWSFLSFVVLVLITWSCQATTMSELQQKGRVFIKASVTPTDTVSLRQQTTITIEVGTDTWFTKGTRVHRFEVENALIANRSRFAINGTQRRYGKTYAIQQWEVTLYPLTTGKLAIPSITVELQVKGDNGDPDVAGYLVTKPVTFEVNKPSAMMVPDKTWLVSSNIFLQQEWSSPSSKDQFVVGSALQRDVELQVQGSTIMLLPERLSEIQSTTDYQVYFEAINKQDLVNRGEYTAVLQEQYTVVFDTAGKFTLPSIDVYQWNPKTQQLARHELPGKSVFIKHTFRSYLSTYWIELFVLVITICVLGFAGNVSFRRYKMAKERGRLPLLWSFLLALRTKDNVRLENVVYLKIMTLGCSELTQISSDVNFVRIINKINQSRYIMNVSQQAPLSKFDWLTIWYRIERAPKAKLPLIGRSSSKRIYQPD
ncbi:protein BatD [Vibrio mediterranei]|nr:protein BatD [Vibrio mediterranei]